MHDLCCFDRMLCSLSQHIFGGSLEVTVDIQQRPRPQGISSPSPPVASPLPAAAAAATTAPQGPPPDPLLPQQARATLGGCQAEPWVLIGQTNIGGVERVGGGGEWKQIEGGGREGLSLQTVTVEGGGGGWRKQCCGSSGAGANLVLGACQWLRLRSGTSQWWRVLQRRQWQPWSEGAARLLRLQVQEAEWNEDIPRISLIQIFVIEIAI